VLFGGYALAERILLSSYEQSAETNR